MGGAEQASANQHAHARLAIKGFDQGELTLPPTMQNITHSP